MKVLVVSHGSFAKSLVETGAMITGFNNASDFFILDSDKNIAEYENEIFTYFEDYNDDILVLADIQGGSPFNTVLKLIRQSSRNNIYIITGINLPLYIEVVSLIKFDNSNLTQIVEQIKSIKDSSIKFIN